MPDRETDLALRALDVNQANLALGHDVFTADGATFVRNMKYPRIYDANHVANVTAATPNEIERLLRRVETEFAHCTYREFHVDYRTPPALEARLLFDGYQLGHSLVMLLEGDLSSAPKPCDIRPLDSDATWDAFFALHQMDWNEYTARTGIGGDETVGTDMARTQRLKSPPVRYWLAYADGEPRGYLNAWEGIDGVGQIENLFVQAEYRHRGLTTALIHHCVADARAHGAGPVVIVADASDTPKRMYATMGFRPVAVKRDEYLKTLANPG
jgi:GNAT superfamily N-acetyltransferase